MAAPGAGGIPEPAAPPTAAGLTRDAQGCCGDCAEPPRVTTSWSCSVLPCPSAVTSCPSGCCPHAPPRPGRCCWHGGGRCLRKVCSYWHGGHSWPLHGVGSQGQPTARVPTPQTQPCCCIPHGKRAPGLLPGIQVLQRAHSAAPATARTRERLLLMAGEAIRCKETNLNARQIVEKGI